MDHSPTATYPHVTGSKPDGFSDATISDAPGEDVFVRGGFLQQFQDPLLEHAFVQYAFPGRVSSAVLVGLTSAVPFFLLALYWDGMPPWVVTLLFVNIIASGCATALEVTNAYGRSEKRRIVRDEGADAVPKLGPASWSDATVGLVEEGGLTLQFTITMAVQAITMYAKYAGCVAKYGAAGCVDYVDVYLIAVLEAFCVIAPARFVLVLPAVAVAIVCLAVAWLLPGVDSNDISGLTHASRIGLEFCIALVNLFACWYREAAIRDAFVQHQLAIAEVQRVEAIGTVVTDLTTKMLPASQLKRLIGTTAISEVQRHIDKSKHCAVYHSDVAGFTQWSSSLDANDVVGLLARLTSRFDDAARRSGIEKVKTVGDAYWAVSGIPDTVPDPELRMVVFSLATIRAAAEEIEEFRMSGKAVPAGIRVGVGAGECSGAVVGQQQISYEVFGHAHDRAGILEPSGRVQRVLVCDRVAETIVRQGQATSFFFSGVVSIPDPKGGEPIRAVYVAAAGSDVAAELTAELGQLVIDTGSHGPTPILSRVVSLGELHDSPRSNDGHDHDASAALSPDASSPHTPEDGGDAAIVPPPRARSSSMAVITGQARMRRAGSLPAATGSVILSGNRGPSFGADVNALSGSSHRLQQSSLRSQGEFMTGLSAMVDDSEAAVLFEERRAALEAMETALVEDRSVLSVFRPVSEDEDVVAAFTAFAIRVEQRPFRACAVALPVCLLGLLVHEWAVEGSFGPWNIGGVVVALALSLAFPICLVVHPPTKPWMVAVLLAIYYGSGGIGIVATGLSDNSYLTRNVFYLRFVFAVLKGSVFSIPAFFGAIHDFIPTLAAGITLFAPGVDGERRIRIAVEYTIMLVASYFVGLVCRVANQTSNRRAFVAHSTAMLVADEFERRRELAENVMKRVVPGVVANQVVRWYTRERTSADGVLRPFLAEYESALVMFVDLDAPRLSPAASSLRGVTISEPAPTRGGPITLSALLRSHDRVDALLQPTDGGMLSVSGSPGMPPNPNDSFAVVPVADAAQMARLVKIKSVGDLVLIAGLPGRRSRRVDAYTVAAAIGLVRDIAAGVSAASARVQCRAGVHVGPVVGCVLGYERLTFDVLGDTVNTASRLMSTTDAGEVALSDSAMEHVLKAMEGRRPLSARRAVRSMKGKGDMVAHVADVSRIPDDM